MQIIYQEAFDYLSSLFLHQQELHEKPTRSLQTKISHFSWNPEENVSSVLQEVYDLAIQDKVLFPKVKPKKCDPYIKEFVLNIDKDFIKQQMIEGKLLKSPDIFECDISKLSSSQREKLWDQQGNKIPDRIHLKLPGINSNSNQIDLKVPDWLAKLIRNEKLPEEILNEWEKDYDEALDKAESAVKKND